jgi:hypothetical protein
MEGILGRSEWGNSGCHGNANGVGGVAVEKKKVKQNIEEVNAESVEVVSEGMTWRVLTNSDELCEAMRAVRTNVKEKQRAACSQINRNG